MESRPFVSLLFGQPDVLSRLLLSSWPYSLLGLLTWFMPTGLGRRIPVSPDIKACFPCCSVRWLAGVSFTMSQSRRSSWFWLFPPIPLSRISRGSAVPLRRTTIFRIPLQHEAQTRLLLRNLSAGRAGGRSLDSVPWCNGSAHPSVRRRSVPRFHSFAGRDGGSLEANRR